MTKVLTSASFVSLGICLAAAGCASTAGRGFSNETPSGSVVALGPADCTAVPPVVIMDIEAGSAPSTLSMNISQDETIISSNGNAVTWIMTGALSRQYQFTANGVVVGKPDGVSFSHGASKYDWCFPATPTGTTWKYSINIKRNSDQTTWTCDPTVVSSDLLFMNPRPFALGKLTCFPAK